MLTSVFGTLVKETQYNKITLKLAQSILVKYKKYCFKCKNIIYVSLTNVPKTLINMTVSLIIYYKKFIRRNYGTHPTSYKLQYMLLRFHIQANFSFLDSLKK
jgi:hypothetical protein